MRYVYITIILFIVMLVINFTNIPYRLFILIALAITIAVNQIYLVRSTIKRRLSGQLTIRKQKQNIGFSSVSLVLFWTLFAIAGQEDDIYVALLFWVLLLADMISNRIYKKEKPISIVVNNNELLINDVRIIKRNIESITKINLSGLTDNITFSFSDKSPITIDLGNYNYDDIKTLVSYLAEHSKQNITISENLKRDITTTNKNVAISGVEQ